MLDIVVIVIVFTLLGIFTYITNLEFDRIYYDCKSISNPSESPEAKNTFDHCRVYPESYNVTKFQWVWEKID